MIIADCLQLLGEEDLEEEDDEEEMVDEEDEDLDVGLMNHDLQRQQQQKMELVMEKEVILTIKGKQQTSTVNNNGKSVSDSHEESLSHISRSNKISLSNLLN